MSGKQDEALDGIATSLKLYELQCSMVTGETFFSSVWAGSLAGEYSGFGTSVVSLLKVKVRESNRESQCTFSRLGRR